MSVPASQVRTRIMERIDAFFRSRFKNGGGAPKITLLLLRLHHCMIRIRVEVAREHDLTVGALFTLMTLRAARPDDPITPGELREATLMTSGGMTKVLRSLEDRGLIVRRQHPTDARSTILALSDAGLALVDGILPALDQRDRALLVDPLTREEAGELMHLLEKLDAAAGAF